MSEDHTSKLIDKNDRRLALVIVDVQKKFIRKGEDPTLVSAERHTPTMQKAI
jgi:hypothetical protein